MKERLIDREEKGRDKKKKESTRKENDRIIEID